MPLSHSQVQALPGSFSASRKRTHAEITRSESRSQSPQHPSKRRRTVNSPSLPPSSSSSVLNSTPQPLESARFVGDGLDYRQPVMSTTSTSQPQDQTTIDLTLDDDSPPPRLPTADTASPTAESAFNDGEVNYTGGLVGRAPPFVQHDTDQPQPVIDLSSDDEEVEAQAGGTRITPSSPEVQFMGERVLPQPVAGSNNRRRRPPLPTPPTMGHFGTMANFLRGMTQNVFVNLRGNRELPEETLNRIDGLLDRPRMGRAPMGTAPMGNPYEDFLDVYDDIQMDYGHTAFNLGADLLLIEEPNLHHAPHNRAHDAAYKEPQPAREGFTRNYEEDDMLTCGLCGDELAIGSTEQKQQVWIIKQCGHAYCGDCAHNRNMSKQKNNRDTKRVAGKKANGFKVCAIPGCNKAVDSKTKMFQIYL